LQLLLHICCAPCSIYPLKYLAENGIGVQGYFYNPNIHPYQEWLRRKETLESYSRISDTKVIFDEGYQMEDFLRETVYRENNRCRFCYYLRLKQSAQTAAKEGLDGFTTTLLVSPFQKHDLIRETGETVSRELNFPFHYFDFRPGYKEATLISKQLKMYRQPYCGCIYSEKERFYPKKSNNIGGEKA
jgi:hypothetical protein